MIRTLQCLRTIAVLVTIASSPMSPLAATDLTFTKIADTQTPIPGGTGTFTGPFAFHEVVVDGEYVAFVGFGDNSQHGIYVYSGGLLQVAADTSTPIPGTSDRFDVLIGPSLDDGKVAFSGFGEEFEPEACLGSRNQGVYRFDGARLRVIMDSRTTPLRCLGRGSLSAGRFMVGAGRARVDIFIDHQEKVVLRLPSGRFLLIADQMTEVPGGAGGTFSGFSQVDMDGPTFVFTEPRIDTSLERGIYKNVGSGLQVVADRNTPIPGGAGNFVAFEGIDLDDQRVGFNGRGRFGQTGVYVEEGGTRRVVADTFTEVPGTPEVAFTNFANPIAHSTGNTAFIGQFPGALSGLYAEIAGVLLDIVEQGDAIDGNIVREALSVDKGGMDGRTIAFSVLFDDDSEAVYTVQVDP